MTLLLFRAECVCMCICVWNCTFMHIIEFIQKWVNNKALNAVFTAFSQVITYLNVKTCCDMLRHAWFSELFNKFVCVILCWQNQHIYQLNCLVFDLVRSLKSIPTLFKANLWAICKCCKHTQRHTLYSHVSKQRMRFTCQFNQLSIFLHTYIYRIWHDLKNI